MRTGLRGVGPHRDGVSAERNLPLRWDTEENITWKLALPEFSASTPDSSGATRSFSAWRTGGTFSSGASIENTGVPIWKKHLSDGNRREQKENMSSPSPVTDGQHVYVMTGTGIFTAFDFEGHQRWRRDIPRDYGRFGLNYGYASSPLLSEDALFLQVLHGMRTNDPSYVLRIDKYTGRTVWRVERPTDARAESPDSYTTPALLQHDGVTEIVITGGDVVTGHDQDTGEERWRADGLNPRNNRNYRIVASPVVADGLIYAPTRVRPLLALKPGGRGDVTTSHLVWSTRNGPDRPGRRSPTARISTSSMIPGSSGAWMRRPAKRFYGRKRLRRSNLQRLAGTGPTARSTSRTRMA